MKHRRVYTSAKKCSFLQHFYGNSEKDRPLHLAGCVNRDLMLYQKRESHSFSIALQYKCIGKLLQPLQQSYAFFFLKIGPQQGCQTLQDYGHALHFSRKGTCQSNRCCPPLNSPNISVIRSNWSPWQWGRFMGYQINRTLCQTCV